MAFPDLDNYDLEILDRLEGLCGFSEVVFTTHLGDVLRLTWEDESCRPIWRLDVELPPRV